MSGMRLVFIAALAATSLLLGVAVFAASEGRNPGFVHSPGLQPLQEEGDQTPGARPTVTVQSSGEGANQQEEVENGQGDQGQGNGEQKQQATPGGPSRVAATNPAGKEVHLPCVSNVVRYPAKHPKWQVPEGEGCEPGPPPGVSAGRGNGVNTGARGGPQRTTVTNPGGKCVDLPSTTGAARLQKEHSKWSEGCNSNQGGEGD